MYDIAKDPQVRLPIPVGSSDKAYRFKPRQAIDKIRPVKTLPGSNGVCCYVSHTIIMYAG